MDKKTIFQIAKNARLVRPEDSIESVDQWREDPDHPVTQGLRLQLGLRITREHEQKFNLWPFMVTEPRYRITDGCVVTAMDSGPYSQLGKWMIRSLAETHEVETWVADLGLTSADARELEKHGARIFQADRIMPRSAAMWQTWDKPAYILSCPTKHTKRLWLDSDTLVFRSLRPLYRVMEKQPLVTQCCCSIDPHVADWRSITLNDPKLYTSQGVKWRWPLESDGRPNAGVVGFDLAVETSKQLLLQWSDNVKHAANHEPMRNQLAWWDQGALILAMEQLGWTDQLVQQNLGWNQAMARWFFQPATVAWDIIENRSPTVLHFAGHPKPIGNEFRFNREPAPEATVFVLGHDDDQLDQIANRPWLRKVDLRSLVDGGFARAEWAESLIYLRPPLVDSKYVGLASASWNRKYGHCIDTVIHKLPLTEDTVWCGNRADADFQAVKRSVHRDSEWIGEICREVAGMSPKGPAPWSSNFICHRDHFAALCDWMREKMPQLLQRVGWDNPLHDCPDPRRRIAYACEELSMLWWSNQRLEFRSI